MLRLRRLRGYAQHERIMLNDSTPTPFALSVAERSRRVRSATERANLMPLPNRGEGIKIAKVYDLYPPNASSTALTPLS